jgi:hypothetical protein
MMFSKLTLASVVSAMALLAVATPVPTDGGSSSQCNTGSTQCCTSVSTSGDPVTKLLLGLLGVAVNGLNVPIGLTCSPLTIIGANGGVSW